MEPEGISSVIEGGRHDAEARRSKVCLGKRGDRRVGEALEEGSFGPSKPPSASFPESLQKTSSVCSCVRRSLPSWYLSVSFSDEGERASGSPQLLSECSGVTAAPVLSSAPTCRSLCFLSCVLTGAGLAHSSVLQNKTQWGTRRESHSYE